MDNPLDFQLYTACVLNIKIEVKFRSEHRQKSPVPFVLQKPLYPEKYIVRKFYFKSSVEKSTFRPHGVEKWGNFVPYQLVDRNIDRR